MSIASLTGAPTPYEVTGKIDELITQVNQNDTDIDAKISTSQKGASSGVASLASVNVGDVAAGGCASRPSGSTTCCRSTSSIFPGCGGHRLPIKGQCCLAVSYCDGDTVAGGKVKLMDSHPSGAAASTSSSLVN